MKQLPLNFATNIKSDTAFEKPFGIIPRFTIRLVKEAEFHTSRSSVNSSNDAYTIVSPFFDGADREYMAVLLLDTKHQIIGFQEVSRGTINTASVYPREIVKLALLANAAAIILAHNHPSGIPEPSIDDRRITQDIQKACSLFDIRVLDHLILGDGTFFSLADRGLMNS